MKVKFKKVRDNFKIPTKGTDNAACFDVYASEIDDFDGVSTIVYLGFKTEIPEGYKGVLVPRSNFTKTTWMMQNSPGQIDSDYRGEWQMRFKQLLVFDNITKEIYRELFPYKVGERVGQIYFEKVLDVEIEQSTSLSETDRDEGGFGSTGKL